MHVLALAALSFLNPCSPPRHDASLGAELPLRVPKGWQSRVEAGARVLTPEGLAAGKVYTVLVPTLTRKVGSLEGLVAAGKETLGEVGKFEPANEPARAENDAGWEYVVVIGALRKDGGAILGQIVALRKGDEEGLVLVVSDSVETAHEHSDAFTEMIRSLGAPEDVPKAPRAAGVDLAFTLPEGWTKKVEAESVLLEGTQQIYDVTTVFRLLVLPSEPLNGSLRQAFLDLWTARLKPAVETSLLPLPFVHRLKSGTLCAFDVDDAAKNASGATLYGGLYLLARGKRVVPVLGFFVNYAGGAAALEKAVAAFLESAVIPDAGAGTVEPFAASDLEGDWSESSAEFANYVTRGGDYAGDATIATGSAMELRKDGGYRNVRIAITGRSRIKEVEEGTWKVDDVALVLTGKESARRYTLFAFGAAPKVGAFLVRSSYSDGDERPDLCRPRRLFSGLWFKRKA